MLDDSKLLQALDELGRTLTDRRLRFHVAIVGGSALLLQGLRDRPTQDVDVVAVSQDGAAPTSQVELPKALLDAAADVATTLGLNAPDWLNAGCVAIIGDRMPEGFLPRAQVRVFHDGLVVSVLGRMDLVRLKLYAASDEGPGSWHVDDLRAMRATTEEIANAQEWIALSTSQHPGFLEDVVATLEERSLGD